MKSKSINLLEEQRNSTTDQQIALRRWTLARWLFSTSLFSALRPDWWCFCPATIFGICTWRIPKMDIAVCKVCRTRAESLHRLTFDTFSASDLLWLKQWIENWWKRQRRKIIKSEQLYCPYRISCSVISPEIKFWQNIVRLSCSTVLIHFAPD